ncbi:Homoserine/homoserine lactone efflux protein [Curvibacter sp. AEP1-3]|uniref:LysE family translocator n=1 Tax=Curvibacter sp. AEP1-3 TaxID=1844971 RepID=UPI000B3C92C3|nr:LysE family translocator [Curvibacter sp. AEP1-3]ARV18995.1 Homoserine/homoserine lactone efflux protein [Curvibacter sp. AEP1-3]
MWAELGIEHLGLFVLSGWLLNLTPGPDVLYIVSNALRSGVRAGIVAAFGITAGCFVHIFAAGLGVSALLATSAMAFTVLKWVGAAYLVFMGIRMLWSKSQPAVDLEAARADSTSAGGLKSIFFRGFLTNALNPKVALFFLAFVPQFIAPGASHPTLAFLVLGVLFNVNAIPINTGYAVLAGWAARRTALVQQGMHWLDRVAGALFVGFGIKLARTAAPEL